MTQAQTILRHIKSLGSISPQEAFRDYQITRLSARILDLKKAGYRIETEMREHPLTGTRYARYHLCWKPVARQTQAVSSFANPSNILGAECP